MSGLARDDGELQVEVAASALRLLAGREHSRRELERKLSARFGDARTVAAVLEDLERQRLLSDERFAESYVLQRIRKGYGPLRIRAELAERGIGAELASQWLDDDLCDWPGVLETTAVRRFGDGPVDDMPALAKRGRFLEQRGFPLGLVRRYLERMRRF